MGITGFYYKGYMYGNSGYFIAFGETEFYFYAGTLGEARHAALKDRGLKDSQVLWKKLS